MKRTFLPILILSLLLFACSEPSEQVPTPKVAEESAKSSRVEKPEFQKILDDAELTGTILIFDAQKNTFYSNDFEWAAVGRLPASTFKIVNSIIALETGVVKDDSTLFEWDGQPRRLKQWEQDLIFREAFHQSCVPCYQEVARKIGPERMKTYLEKFNYGEMVVDSSCIDLFWLEGESKISPFEQIDFLRRFYTSELPIKDHTEYTMKEMMVIEDGETYQLSGKTGWAIRNGHNNGWFVGYIENVDGMYYFAVNVDPQESFNMELFPKIRTQVAMEALRLMGIID